MVTPPRAVAGRGEEADLLAMVDDGLGDRCADLYEPRERRLVAQRDGEPLDLASPALDAAVALPGTSSSARSHRVAPPLGLLTTYSQVAAIPYAPGFTTPGLCTVRDPTWALRFNS